MIRSMSSCGPQMLGSVLCYIMWRLNFGNVSRGAPHGLAVLWL